ncbi:uncharacterized protein LOC110893018 [Helianthus annuus]|uniref:uncharacterized protein LOC110893018 n=1 Tax=Helianthus annuus TaxID=4232 RepID=UPI000B8F542C|nr:uncharacterized protein LOC110893018 [Helianthus annuus]
MADEIPLFFPLDSNDDELASTDSTIIFFSKISSSKPNYKTRAHLSKKRYVRRDHESGHETLMADYFVEDPKYNDDIFRHRFRMSKRLFLKIVSEVEANNPWFEEGVSARMNKGFTPLQKLTSAIKQLATGNPLDENDEYLHMAERTSRECLEYFCQTVCKIYAPEFLRRPTSYDMALLYQTHEKKNHLRGMVGSLDCTHFVWRMCPTQFQDQYMSGDHQYPTIMWVFGIPYFTNLLTYSFLEKVKKDF